MIAADGGARHPWRLGLIPDVIIGDLNSLHPGEAANFDRSGASIYRFPEEKDETDLELALDFAMEKGATEITLFGLLGGRWDMSLANILLLAAPRYRGIHFRVIEGDTEMHILRGGESLTLTGAPGDPISVIPLAADAHDLTYHGLKWPLENATLPFGTPRGVSNEMGKKTAEISLTLGVILIIHKKVNRQPGA